MITPAKIEKILTLLERSYGRPPAFRKTEPVDELIRTVLSQNTTDKNSLKAFGILKIDFKSWGDLLATPTAKIARLIRHAGLANIKAERIKSILAEITRREGLIRIANGIERKNKGTENKISLSRLAKLSTKDALEYLTSLKGVGPKTAACVLLFSFARPVMPVDTHIFRVAKRLAIIGKLSDIKEAHGRLAAIVPKHLIYRFHLGIIEHGRRTCKAKTPKCGVCVIYGLCRFNKKEYYKKRERSCR